MSAAARQRAEQVKQLQSHPSLIGLLRGWRTEGEMLGYVCGISGVEERFNERCDRARRVAPLMQEESLYLTIALFYFFFFNVE